ncbi:YjjI family glycine radical enzyme [Shewanella sp. NIFS-20-20]|uniref:YjjI family glycine radical enzyme n=1 Tax=Shewanella sp. NIFS-20-20 TaxID=2853806 RepID=UPI001C479A02|nr:YjjI family glycine radical enzyme [Shewanella sp. NIFS-20-20]MBV7316526.1 YjjI family glycine radical enzyme [Shewanella sp. NIFS-20-20]
MTLVNIQKIIGDANLSAQQKSQWLALQAEGMMPYPCQDKSVLDAMASGVICDMFEGNAPFKPRYVLPDYEVFLAKGSDYLELAPATDFDDALHMLSILYHHVPSVTGIPVFLGHLDRLLMPYVGELTAHEVYTKLRRFWVMLDRTLPDAFMHVNIGPSDNLVCRTILAVDAELKQIAPNLTFYYDKDITPESLLLKACINITECSKPHIANTPLHNEVFGEGRFGIVSCYNALPLGGGANTLVRLNLKSLAQLAISADDFFDNLLEDYCQRVFTLIDARSEFLHQESGFFNSFLVKEGLIDEARFVPMFGIFGMAEAVQELLTLEGCDARYGYDAAANQLALRISARLHEIVSATEVKYGWQQRALLHAQGGISLDVGVTPGVRIAYGQEPDPVSYVMATAPQHQYYPSGISDILTLDATIKANPTALMDLCLGAFASGYREFTANVESNDLVRITGYMVKLSDIAKYQAEGSRTNTTFLGAEAADKTQVLARRPRVVSQEMSPVFMAKANS